MLLYRPRKNKESGGLEDTEEGCLAAWEGRRGREESLQELALVLSPKGEDQQPGEEESSRAEAQSCVGNPATPRGRMGGSGLATAGTGAGWRAGSAGNTPSAAVRAQPAPSEARAERRPSPPLLTSFIPHCLLPSQLTEDFWVPTQSSCHNGGW